RTMPGFRLFHFCPHEKREHRRQSADKKQGSPSPMRIDKPVRPRRQQESQRVALLQQSGNQPPPFCGDGFHVTRSSHATLASHSDDIEQAQDKKDPIVRSESGENFNQRVIQDVDNQRNAPPVAIRQQTEDNRSNPSRGEARSDGQRHRRDGLAKFRRDGRQNKRQDEKIERVECPAEKSGQDCVVSAFVRPGRLGRLRHLNPRSTRSRAASAARAAPHKLQRAPAAQNQTQSSPTASCPNQTAPDTPCRSPAPTIAGCVRGLASVERPAPNAPLVSIPQHTAAPFDRTLPARLPAPAGSGKSQQPKPTTSPRLQLMFPWRKVPPPSLKKVSPKKALSLRQWRWPWLKFRSRH